MEPRFDRLRPHSREGCHLGSLPGLFFKRRLFHQLNPERAPLADFFPREAQFCSGVEED